MARAAPMWGDTILPGVVRSESEKRQADRDSVNTDILHSFKKAKLSTEKGEGKGKGRPSFSVVTGSRQRQFTQQAPRGRGKPFRGSG